MVEVATAAGGMATAVAVMAMAELMVVVAAEMEMVGQQVIRVGVPAAVAMVKEVGETVTVVEATAREVAEMAMVAEETAAVVAEMVMVGMVKARAVAEMATVAQMRRHTLAAQSGSGSAPRLPGVPSPNGQRSCRRSSRRRDLPSSSRRNTRRTRVICRLQSFQPRPRSCRGNSGSTRRRYGCTRPPGQFVTTPEPRPRAMRSSDNCWRQE